MTGRSFRVSADIGGTFTDLVFQDAETGVCEAFKVLSTPHNPALAVIEGVEKHLPEGSAVDFFVHGTTVGLNAVLTRRGARVALVTTKNYRDIYTIQGNDRGEIFSIHWRKPRPPVEIPDTYTVAERINAKGEIETPLDVAELDAVVEAVRGKGYEAIAVCLLFSFKNPAHELAVEAYLKERLPGLPITLSHRVSPEWREYARTSTTAMDAYAAPVVRRYLDTLVAQLSSRLPKGRQLHVMKSNGGAMTAAAATDMPLQTLLSGPVGGAIGGQTLAAEIGKPNLICVDMGGTSFDASLIIEGKPSASNEAELEGLPIQMSVVDIHVIGAGGGSIAWEEAGAVRVGPKSAGSVPGPACYGRGGTEPTVSDANLVLGRLDSSNFAGGSMTLDKDKAREAVGALGARFGFSTEAMAQGIIDIINAKMADAIRTITIRRGIDPRDFALVAYGGAGPAQAVALAQQLDIREVVIPVMPGAFSAWGMLQTDVRHDFKMTYYGFWHQIDAADLAEKFAALEAEGTGYLEKEGFTSAEISFERFADFRYHGQEYVLTIPVPAGAIDMAAVRASFDEAYDRQYGHSSPEAQVEVANLRVAALGTLARPGIPDPAVLGRTAPRDRRVYFDGVEHDAAVLNRDEFAKGEAIEGPAIIEEATATTILPPDWRAEVITGGQLLLTRR
ncbi:hydantoinase/oxoprolinase family protein [Aquibium sp. ELW1220]|uniref:hydantoinase/oxoprolinase family protein n=1 Tax=Aquibium sp. ELW1220 TaxID=2976766 RepID=UPI0025B16378|nr:hydantoinase/oxoprolinase family protein [Aquibium sp. ELW1220]MDN2583816.1 hydantoinase/oxoprolinase family protein [Aquibium sp. ELW1220]